MASLFLGSILALAGCGIQQSPIAESPEGPKALSLAPASGSGRTQVFAAEYTHPRGSTEITGARVLFNRTVDGRKGCYVFFDRGSASLLLANDSGEGSSRAAIGSSSAIRNGQCQIDTLGSSAIDKGKTLTLRIPVTFLDNFSGEKNVYLYAEDRSGKATQLEPKGTWIVPEPK